MEISDGTILSITVVYQRQEYLLKVPPSQYHSLMSLISNELNIPGFGLCNGMGSCGTCQVSINKLPAMACEISVSSGLDGALVEIEELGF